MEGFHMKKGDLFILISAFFWGSHLIVIDMISHRHHPIAFAIRQFFVCGILSLIAALVVGESMIVPSINGWAYICISGIVAIALGYTLQIYGQQVTPPSQAALIFSTEAVFSAIAGIYFLGEVLGSKAVIGCVLMLTGSLMAQFYPPINHRATEQKSLP